MSNKISRLSFIRLGTIFGAGTFVESVPGMAEIAKFLGISPAVVPDISFSCELFRAADLLHFRYFFYNAKLDCGRIKKVLRGSPVFAYIQLPSQHVGEQLLTDPFNYTDRTKFKKLESFLSGNSFLAFRTFKKEVDIEFTCEELLEWVNNFSLVTLDDFVPASKPYRQGYKQGLSMVKKAMDDRRNIPPSEGETDRRIVWLDNMLNDKNVSWPLTSFEVPYKMMLSPIAEPHEFVEGTDDYKRKSGEHLFAFSNKLRCEFFGKNFCIVRPWENKLIFRTNENTELLPRFKVVQWMCQEGVDNDNGKELLPSPLNRCELHNLTMLPEFDRDVWSELFQISSLGVNTDLFYKNDNPLKFSLVAWEQRIRYARDNFVSVTYRAVDHFTGLKLKVSIIAERDYKHDVSFLPKLYFVTYAEEYKIYDEPVVISNIHCTKITPLVKGAYFFPTKVPGLTLHKVNAYAVDNQIAEHLGGFDCNRLLDFEYLCADKKGEAIKMKMKMIFIPAETYKLLSGIYNYCKEKGGTVPYNHRTNPSVNIEHIGQLNPSKLVGHDGKNPCNCETPNPKNPCTGVPDVYTFEIGKTFSVAKKNDLQATLTVVNKHVKDHKLCYESKVDSEITYGKIEGLKVNEKQDAVKKDAANATFPTRSVLLGESQINDKLYIEPYLSDNYLARFPIIPGLMSADIIISQIDQIEGRSVYRTVSYAEKYREGDREIDVYNDENLAKLLFKLDTQLGNFFADNYKSSGAVVNPGIEITHVSVFDQGITYNDEVNKVAKAFSGPQRKSVAALAPPQPLLTNVPSISVFKPLKAEILGVSILDIIDDILPINDLPIFSVIQQTNDTIEKINATIAEYAGIVNEWKARYDEARQLVETIPTQIKLLESSIKGYLNGELKKWLDAIIGRIADMDYYGKLKEKVDVYKRYKTELLEAVWKGVIAKNANIEAKIKAFVDNPAKDSLVILLKEIKNEVEPLTLSRYKEAIKIYVVRKVTDAEAYRQVQKQLVALEKEIDAEYRAAYNAAIEGVMEAQVFINKYVEEQAALLEKQVNETLANIQSEFSAFLKKKGIKLEDIVMVCQLISTFEQYANIYKNLKAGNYEQIAKDFGISMPQDVIDEVKNTLKEQLKKEVKELVENITRSLPLPDQKPYLQFRDELNKQLDDYQNAFDHCQEIVRSINVEKVLERYLRATIENLEEYKAAKKALDENIQKFEKAKKEIEAFGRDFIGRIKEELEKKKRELINEVKGSEAYNAIVTAINELEKIKRKISEIAHQRLNYTFSTGKFRNASLGVISFSPNQSSGKTSLSVHVVYDVEFDISRLDRAPTIKKQSFLTETTLNSFKLGFLQLIFVEFEKVSFVTGSDVKDDFQVKIKNVEFGGPLNFVEAFKSFLQSIDRNLVFSIDASGARIGYGFPLPDITAGYFNFFNFSITALLTLPFNPAKSLQLNFGLGSELNKFGITVCGIFGGQGYFNIIVEPKRGVVGMILVLEFGAIFNLNIGVAWGTAYLVAGIYIKRYNGNVEMRGYILCVGRFNVIGLFSASLSFYMGLEGNSHVMVGKCEVIASHRFTRWFEISVSCGYEKTIKGAKSEQNSAGNSRYVYLGDDMLLTNEMTNLTDKGISVVGTNMHHAHVYPNYLRGGSDSTKLYMNIAKPGMKTVSAKFNTGTKINSFNALKIETVNELTQTTIVFSQDMLPQKSNGLLNLGTYKLTIQIDGVDYYKIIHVIDPRSPIRKKPSERERKISKREYYAAYYR